MKITLKKFALLVFTVIFMSNANAINNPLKDKDSKALITAFVETITMGSETYHKFLFTEDFSYQNHANNDQFSKKQYLKHLKQTKGMKFNCNTDYKILDETGDSCVAKSTMQFDTFTRVDYITLRKTDDGWKVSKVVTTYPY